MAKTGVTFTGGAEMKAALESLSKVASRNARREALLAAGVPIKSVAASIAPRGPGAGPHLADHIEVAIERGVDLQELIAVVGPERRPDFIFWGYFQEFGTVHQAAQAFMRPAFDEAWSRSLSVFRTWMWHEIKRRLPRVR